MAVAPHRVKMFALLVHAFQFECVERQIERTLHVNVLSQSWWPTYPEKQVILPEAMVHALESFKEFWLKKQSGRKIMWRHALGHCIVSADFPKVSLVRDAG